MKKIGLQGTSGGEQIFSWKRRGGVPAVASVSSSALSKHGDHDFASADGQDAAVRRGGELQKITVSPVGN
jgi:hypothetical protein